MLGQFRRAKSLRAPRDTRNILEHVICVNLNYSFGIPLIMTTHTSPKQVFQINLKSYSVSNLPVFGKHTVLEITTSLAIFILVYARYLTELIIIYCVINFIAVLYGRTELVFVSQVLHLLPEASVLGPLLFFIYIN